MSLFSFCICVLHRGERTAMKLLKSVIALRGAVVALTSGGIGTSAAAQMKATREASGDALDFVVVVLFGPREDVERFLKKFSLFKG